MDKASPASADSDSLGLFERIILSGPMPVLLVLSTLAVTLFLASN